MTMGPRSEGWPGSNQFRSAQVTTGSIAGAGTAAITVTWPVAMSSADYTVVANVLEATASTSTLRVHHIQSQTATAVVVRIVNDDPTVAKTGTIHAVALGGAV